MHSGALASFFLRAWVEWLRESVCDSGREPVTDTAAPAARAQAAAWTELVTLAGFCAYLFFFGLGSFGLVGADEPRYAQIAREMLARHDWITPTLNGLPWLEKPALYYWSAMVSYKLFGVSDWAARLPSAVFATAMIAAIYGFVRRFQAGMTRGRADRGFVCGRHRIWPRRLHRHAAGGDADPGSARLVRLAGDRTQTVAGDFLLHDCAGHAGQRSGRAGAGGRDHRCICPDAAVGNPHARLIADTLWIPGVLLFFAVALPWYVAVQMKTPQFFQVFILQHNWSASEPTCIATTSPTGITYRFSCSACCRGRCTYWRRLCSAARQDGPRRGADA